MSKTFKLSTLMMGVASLTLSTGVWAGSLNPITDPVTDLFNSTEQVVTTPVSDDWKMDQWRMDGMTEPDYKVTDQTNRAVRYLDGIENGRVVSDQGNTIHKKDCLKGDTLTNLKTQKSGVIKGIKDQGTMEVTTPNGNTVRYQYVTFSVKPL